MPTANANGDQAGDRTIFNPNGIGNTGSIVDCGLQTQDRVAQTSVVAPNASGAYFCNAGHNLL